MRRSIVDQVEKLCHMKPWERIEYEDRLNDVHKSNVKSFKQTLNRERMSIGEVDMIQLNKEKLISPIHNEYEIIKRGQKNSARQ